MCLVTREVRTRCNHIGLTTAVFCNETTPADVCENTTEDICWVVTKVCDVCRTHSYPLDLELRRFVPKSVEEEKEEIKVQKRWLDRQRWDMVAERANLDIEWEEIRKSTQDTRG